MRLSIISIFLFSIAVSLILLKLIGSRIRSIKNILCLPMIIVVFLSTGVFLSCFYNDYPAPFLCSFDIMGLEFCPEFPEIYDNGLVNLRDGSFPFSGWKSLSIFFILGFIVHFWSLFYLELPIMMFSCSIFCNSKGELKFGLMIVILISISSYFFVLFYPIFDLLVMNILGASTFLGFVERILASISALVGIGLAQVIQCFFYVGSLKVVWRSRTTDGNWVNRRIEHTRVRDSITVRKLKNKISKLFDIPPEEQILRTELYSRNFMDNDDRKIRCYGIDMYENDKNVVFIKTRVDDLHEDLEDVKPEYGFLGKVLRLIF